MDQKPPTNTHQPWQFSLGSLLLAMVFMAIACAAAKYFIASIDPPGDTPPETLDQVLSFCPILFFLCGAIGVLRGKLKFWLSFGVVCDLVLVLLAFLFFPPVH